MPPVLGDGLARGGKYGPELEAHSRGRLVCLLGDGSGAVRLDSMRRNREVADWSGQDYSPLGADGYMWQHWGPHWRGIGSARRVDSPVWLLNIFEPEFDARFSQFQHEYRMLLQARPGEESKRSPFRVV